MSRTSNESLPRALRARRTVLRGATCTALALVLSCSSSEDGTNPDNQLEDGMGGATWGMGGATGTGNTFGSGGLTGAGGYVTPSTCGNGVLDAGEQCEGGNLGGQTCASATMGAMPTGNLLCTAGCAVDTSQCGGGMGGAGAGGTGSGGVSGTGGLINVGGSGQGGSGVGGAVVVPSGPNPTNLPTAREACPTIQTGSVSFLGKAVQIWAGPPSAAGGPVVFYFHGTGSSAQEAVSGLGQGAINEVTTTGGVIASFTTTIGTGTNTGNNVWFTGDFDIADEILACAIQQLGVNPRRVHAAGYSAGGLQTGTMGFLRSGYLASQLIYSGGAILTNPNQNPNHTVHTVCAHGAPGSDVFILDFGQGCLTYLDGVKSRGGVAIDCNDGGAHISAARFQVAPGAWQFFKDHPYGVDPKPYSGSLPASFPAHCRLY